MFAVIKTGGKQYRVAPGDTIRIERVKGDVGEKRYLRLRPRSAQRRKEVFLGFRRQQSDSYRENSSLTAATRKSLC